MTEKTSRRKFLKLALGALVGASVSVENSGCLRKSNSSEHKADPKYLLFKHPSNVLQKKDGTKKSPKEQLYDAAVASGMYTALSRGNNKERLGVLLGENDLKDDCRHKRKLL